MFRRMVVLVIVFGLFITVFAAKKISHFSGEWSLDTEKSDVSEMQLYLLNISVEATKDSLLTARVYSTESGEWFPFDENVSLDGTVLEHVIFDMPRKVSAVAENKGANIVVNSTTTFYGNSGEVDILIKETWSVDKKDKILTIDFVTTWPDGEATQTLYYKK